jgi:hypothetical protein
MLVDVHVHLGIGLDAAAERAVLGANAERLLAR